MIIRIYVHGSKAAAVRVVIEKADIPIFTRFGSLVNDIYIRIKDHS